MKETTPLLGGDQRRADDDNIIEWWRYLFYINVFLSCVSFSIIMPTLWPYLQGFGAGPDFLAWTVAIYSVGEGAGSLLFGPLYNRCPPKVVLIVCMLIGVAGSTIYLLASLGSSPWWVFIGRLLQGIWTGGEQVVEQAYVADVVPKADRTSVFAGLGSAAVLGFVLGPSFGAACSDVRFQLGSLMLNANNVPALLVAGMTMVMVGLNLWLFDPVTRGSTVGTNDEVASEGSSHSEGETSMTPTSPSVVGVSIALLIFFAHFYSFAIQETVTTPLLQRLYGWSTYCPSNGMPCTSSATGSQAYVDFVFVGSGLLSLLTTFGLQWLSGRVEDVTLLFGSMVIGLLGSLSMLDVWWIGVLPLWACLIGLALMSVAFPLGRNVCISVYSQVVGPVPQGTYMGIMFCVGAAPRILGPFWAVRALDIPDPVIPHHVWRASDGTPMGPAMAIPHTWLEFSLPLALFGVALLVASSARRSLEPHPLLLLEDAANEASVAEAGGLGRLNTYAILSNHQDNRRSSFVRHWPMSVPQQLTTVEEWVPTPKGRKMATSLRR